MKSVLVPLPAPGAPPSRISSLGKRILLRLVFPLELLPDAAEDELRVLDFEIGGVSCGSHEGSASFYVFTFISSPLISNPLLHVVVAISIGALGTP